jgi:hypothetical protein
VVWQRFNISHTCQQQPGLRLHSSPARSVAKACTPGPLIVLSHWLGSPLEYTQTIHAAVLAEVAQQQGAGGPGLKLKVWYGCPPRRIEKSGVAVHVAHPGSHWLHNKTHLWVAQQGASPCCVVSFSVFRYLLEPAAQHAGLHVHVSRGAMNGQSSKCHGQHPQAPCPLCLSCMYPCVGCNEVRQDTVLVCPGLSCGGVAAACSKNLNKCVPRTEAAAMACLHNPWVMRACLSVPACACIPAADSQQLPGACSCSCSSK